MKKSTYSEQLRTVCYQGALLDTRITSTSPWLQVSKYWKVRLRMWNAYKNDRSEIERQSCLSSKDKTKSPEVYLWQIRVMIMSKPASDNRHVFELHIISDDEDKAEDNVTVLVWQTVIMLCHIACSPSRSTTSSTSTTITVISHWWTPITCWGPRFAQSLSSIQPTWLICAINWGDNTGLNSAQSLNHNILVSLSDFLTFPF